MCVRSLSNGENATYVWGKVSLADKEAGAMRRKYSDLIVNERHYVIQKVNEYNTGEGWASYEVVDAHSNFAFRVMECFGAQSVLQKVRRKAERLERLGITGLPQIYAMPVEKQSLFIFTDVIKGLTLREYLLSRKGPAGEDMIAMVEYGRRLCTILDQLHPAFVHCRLQPEHIILCGSRIFLADLGFLLVPGGFADDASPYRAPEQRRNGQGETLGHWTDIYAFGVLLGEMLTGQCPGGGDHGSQVKPSAAWQRVPGELKDVVVHCTQFLPRHRPAKIGDVKRKLSQWLLFRKGEMLRGISSGNVALTQPAEPAGTGHGRQHMKRVAGKMAFVISAACCGFALLFLLQTGLSGRPADFAQTVKSADPANVVRRADVSLQRRESVDQLSGVWQAAGLLLSDYRKAVVPDSQAQTVRNFRAVQFKADELRRSIPEAAMADAELQKVVRLEHAMCELLQSAAEIFADYIEGSRKITGSVDWVEEANMRYGRALELHGQVAGELAKLTDEKGNVLLTGAGRTF